MSLKDRFNTPNNEKAEENVLSSSYYPEKKLSSGGISLGVADSLIEDDDINMIFISGAKNIFVERKNKIHRSTVAYRDEIQLQNIIKKYMADNDNFAQFNYRPGINITATIPPLSKTSSMCIKCYREKFSTLENLEEKQVLSKEISIFFQTVIKNNSNIIIAGDKKTLKTTLLSALIKKMPVNNRYCFIDFSKEIETDKPNFTSYDLSEIKSKEQKENILNSIFYSSPTGIFINDFNFDIDCIINNITNGFKGLIFNLEAKSKKEAIEKISLEIKKTIPYLTFEEAVKKTHEIFDFIIFVENKEERKVSSVSEIRFDENENKNTIDDIFLLNNEAIHYSTGYVPFMFLENNIDSVNLNIFNKEYKHTYYVSPFKDTQKKGLNPDILKKFKKELNKESFEKFSQEKEETEQTNPIEQCKIDESLSSKISENVEIVYNEEFFKKAQEKFDEIRKNMKNDENNKQN